MFNPEIHHRHSIRLKNYDYSQPGAYFVTVVTYQRETLFGQIANDEMTLNENGIVVQSCWEQIPLHFPTVHNDAFVVMPNHIHGIIIITYEGTVCRAPTESFGKPTVHSVPTIIRSFKSTVSKKINELRHMPGSPIWQRNYYEHIIRNDGELNEIKQYISNNILQWALDRENPHNSR